MAEEGKVTGPYVLLSLMPEMQTTDEEGYMHMPLAIESWPPGMDVVRLLKYALESLEREDDEAES